jgi:hypothetical protein
MDINKVEVGDYVRCIRVFIGSSSLTIGCYYQVTKIDDSDDCYIYYITDNNGLIYGYYSFRFEYSESYNRKKKLEKLELLYG